MGSYIEFGGLRMGKWWKVNRQAKISEYDTTPKKGWMQMIHIPALGDYITIGISLSVYWGILTYVIPEWYLWHKIPIAMVAYIITYLALKIGWRIIDNRRIREEALSK